MRLLQILLDTYTCQGSSRTLPSHCSCRDTTWLLERYGIPCVKTVFYKIIAPTSGTDQASAVVTQSKLTQALTEFLNWRYESRRGKGELDVVRDFTMILW
eukprot:Blabericola_migrator_1__6936@NODE_3513_length_1717_cov_7_342424_g2181_i0_p2_GENE_NODE_3513_length_1717_cov_7_342424_g2181_i0NODE_3513_length_1717_cov_7_342424_g2181_i0_p2_ORF_typecomplete_len100_score9_31_NODE_3513_length_1717_cov_7_342424_g2181_i012891588